MCPVEPTRGAGHRCCTGSLHWLCQRLPSHAVSGGMVPSMSCHPAIPWSGTLIVMVTSGRRTQWTGGTGPWSGRETAALTDRPQAVALRPRHHEHAMLPARQQEELLLGHPHLAGVPQDTWGIDLCQARRVLHCPFWGPIERPSPGLSGAAHLTLRTEGTCLAVESLRCRMPAIAIRTYP